MTENTEYCIAMINVEQREKINGIPLSIFPLIMHSRHQPVLVNDPTVALEYARGYKELHPEIDFEVRRFLGSSVLYQACYFGWLQIGREGYGRV